MSDDNGTLLPGFAVPVPTVTVTDRNGEQHTYDAGPAHKVRRHGQPAIGNNFRHM
jgi:hypothetical protein